MQHGDRIEDAEGKYLLRDIHWSIAHKAKLSKPLFWKYLETTATYTRVLSFVRENCKAGEAHQKGLVSPH